ncbi:Acg family FMN-binding oxidoreductase [Halorussus ruber]|uniref:Acg family FMN-binding oxidoreductase n=1 Tax=Halorussus ruber TaxID=1126238 RepID=UPI00109261DB|nr:nitroreductase family protein [Halorussus ruber]
MGDPNRANGGGRTDRSADSGPTQEGPAGPPREHEPSDRKPREREASDRKQRRKPTEGERGRETGVAERLGLDALSPLSGRRRWVGGKRPWRVSASMFPAEGTPTEQAQFLVRYAVLAPSSHNTQPWLFNVNGEEIRLFADLERWLTVADPDKRELYVSLGAALENLLVAAERFGVGYEVEYLPGSDSAHAATVRLSVGDREERTESQGGEASGEMSVQRDSQLFEAIPQRRTNRSRYQERPIPREDLQSLREACVEKDVRLQFVADPAKLDVMADLAARADRRQFADPAYRRELGRWIGRGAFGDSWLEAKIGKFLMTYLNIGGRQARKDAGLLRATPLVAVIRTKSDGRRGQIRAGQVYQRVSLLATVLGVETHPMSAMLEVPSLRRELTNVLGNPEWTPQHLLRLGYTSGVSEPSPRRPAEAVLID